MRTRIVFGLAALLAASGCTANTFVGGDAGNGNPPPVGGGADEDAGSQADTDAGSQPDVAPPPSCDTSKLPTDDACVINEAEGIFVSSSKGTAVGDGSMATPIASLEAGIMAAKKSGKRVYACAETYAEAITLEDGVSVFGYFDCGNGWMVGTSHAKVQSPTSPVARATNITTATRVEAVDLVAPDFSGQSQSSIGLIADGSPALTIVHATIHAGAGGKGDDGANGTQLQDSGNAKNGAASWAAGKCSGMICPQNYFGSAAGGTNACQGAPGHDGYPGGLGGAAGHFTSTDGVSWFTVSPSLSGNPTAATAQTAHGGFLGASGGLGANGIMGTDGTPGAAIGTVAVAGYAPSDGTRAADGEPGQGGGGAGAYDIKAAGVTPASNAIGWGEAGAGGGAGGCPGLAADPGRGGGASIAVVAVQSPFTLDHVTVEASVGGAGGAAGAPSLPTAGGLGGSPSTYTKPGGNGGMGGRAGASGNGGGGPSIGVAYQGSAPQRLATSIVQGAGGSGVAQRVLPDGTVISASPDGLGKDVYPF